MESIDSSSENTSPIPPEAGAEPPTPAEHEMSAPAEPASAEAAPSAPVIPEPAPAVKAAKKPRRSGPRWVRYLLLGLLGLALIAGLSGYFGYQAGIDLRKGAQSTRQVGQLEEQVALAQQDIADLQFSRARQRLEYVIQQDPAHPGVTELYAQVLLAVNSTATATVIPTPTLTPTPDNRGQEEIFNIAQTAAQNKEWTKAVDTVLDLRKAYPAYRPVELDGILYLAYRNRGIDKIKGADLEGGIYDLTLAGRLGPLDNEAEGYLTWTSMYITGASFWDIDYEQVVGYFSEIAPQLPNLVDRSGLTAIERLRQGLLGWAIQLAAGGDCDTAGLRLEESAAMGVDQKTEEAIAEVTRLCTAPTEEEKKNKKTPAPDATQEPQPTSPYPAP